MAQYIFFYQIGNVIGSTRGNVGKAPSGFKLELRNRMMKELQEDWNQIGIDYSLNRRIFLN